MVIRVDEEKGYIDLSKRRVSTEDIIKTEEKFRHAKTVHGIMKHVSAKLQIPMVVVYPKIAWALAKKYGNNIYEALQAAVHDPKAVLGPLNLTEDEFEETLAQIKLKMTPTPLKIRTDIQVTCFNYEGVNAIKKALNKANELHSEEFPISIQLIAPPLYVITTVCLDKQRGIQILTDAIQLVKASIESDGGALNIKAPPAVLSSQEDLALAKLLRDKMNMEPEEDENSDEDDIEEDEEEDGMGAADDDEEAAAGSSNVPAATEGGAEDDAVEEIEPGVIRLKIKGKK
jgi:translation initiation factor 2 subunit 1